MPIFLPPSRSAAAAIAKANGGGGSESGPVQWERPAAQLPRPLPEAWRPLHHTFPVSRNLQLTVDELAATVRPSISHLRSIASPSAAGSTLPTNTHGRGTAAAGLWAEPLHAQRCHFNALVVGYFSYFWALTAMRQQWILLLWLRLQVNLSVSPPLLYLML